MNRQRKVLITITYNELWIIIDTKAEEVAQPDLQPTCNQLATDCISRQVAIDAVEKKIRYTDHDEPVVDWNDFVAALCFLPSAQPQRKKGKWIRVPGRLGSEEVECDQCNSVFWSWMANYSFCPSCGANMGSVRRCFT